MSPEFIKAEMALFAAQAKDVDIIITTALIPGKPAPKLITAEMVRSMKPGSVVVDLAAEQGGNCELTEPGKVVERDGVTIIGYTDMPSRLAAQSSQLYATNLRHLLTDMCPKKDGALVVDFARRSRARRHGGEGPRNHVASPAAETVGRAANRSTPRRRRPPRTAKAARRHPPRRSRAQEPSSPSLVAAVALLGLGAVAPTEFMAHFTVFVLAVFVGYMVVWNVTPALHTPLMSVTNAISSIIIIGGLMQISHSDPVVMWIAGLTVTLTSINIAGGFAVTQRMLEMFRK